MRRSFRRKVWTTALWGGVAIGVVVCLSSFLLRTLSVSSELTQKNQETLARIHCGSAGPAWSDVETEFQHPACDSSAIEDDLAFESADYVIDRQNRFILYNRSPFAGFWFDRSDVNFLRKFRNPKSITFETGDRWRIYSRPAQGGKDEILVAALQSAPWEIGESAVGSDIDEQLRGEADGIAQQLKKRRILTRVDAWQVVEAATGNVREWSPDVPALYPEHVGLPSLMLNLQNGQFWLARSAATERLQALSVASLGSLYAFILIGILSFVLGSIVIYPLARRFARAGITEPIALDDALRSGETDLVEFKQEIKDRHSLLKDVTAFANTKGGTVFIGIVDGTAEIKGIDAVAPERRDAFDRALRDSIRNSIQPSPTVAIDYLTQSDRVVARILVLAGQEPHSYDGRYYIREGTQSRYVHDGDIARL